MIRHQAYKYGRRAQAIAEAETWGAYNVATRDSYMPLSWQVSFWLWRRRQYAKVGRWLNKWRRVWRARREGPRRERAYYEVCGAMYVHPETLAHFTRTLPRAQADQLYGYKLVCSPYVPEWRPVYELDAAGYPSWSPRFSGFPKRDTLAQISNTVMALDREAITNDAYWFRRAYRWQGKR